MKSGSMVVLRDGSLRVIDPDRSMLPVLRELDPSFEISDDPPSAGFVPGFQNLRKGFVCGLNRSDLETMETPMVWAVHKAAMARRIPLEIRGEVSVLDLKVELGRRVLSDCDLCGWRCKANRYQNPGRCGAKGDAYCNGIFDHIAEEPAINPAWNIKLMGCPLKCVFCQASENQDPKEGSKPLGPEAWAMISGSSSCHSLEFAGGEPMVSCPGVLAFLSAAPESFGLPVVMNSSVYLSETSVNLMDGVVDVWMPDFTFGNDQCARRLSSAKNYWETATKALTLICSQGARIIIRILVLPGHVECCHQRVLAWLSQYRDHVWISVMDQYLPLHEASRHMDTNRLPDEGEIQEVRSYGRQNGLNDVSETSGKFWNQGGPASGVSAMFPR